MTQHFKGDAPTAFEVFSFIDCAHAAAAQQPDDAVAAELLRSAGEVVLAGERLGHDEGVAGGRVCFAAQAGLEEALRAEALRGVSREFRPALRAGWIGFHRRGEISNFVASYTGGARLLTSRLAPAPPRRRADARPGENCTMSPGPGLSPVVTLSFVRAVIAPRILTQAPFAPRVV